MKYCEIGSDNNTVKNIFTEYTDEFPNIPINQRFSQGFLDTCIAVEDDFDVQVGYIYSKEDNTFTRPEFIIREIITNGDEEIKVEGEE